MQKSRSKNQLEHTNLPRNISRWRNRRIFCLQLEMGGNLTIAELDCRQFGNRDWVPIV
jgi:hypothetical protein